LQHALICKKTRLTEISGSKRILTVSYAISTQYWITTKDRQMDGWTDRQTHPLAVAVFFIFFIAAVSKCIHSFIYSSRQHIPHKCHSITWVNGNCNTACNNCQFNTINL